MFRANNLFTALLSNEETSRFIDHQKIKTLEKKGLELYGDKLSSIERIVCVLCNAILENPLTMPFRIDLTHSMAVFAMWLYKHPGKKNKKDYRHWPMSAIKDFIMSNGIKKINRFKDSHVYHLIPYGKEEPVIGESSSVDVSRYEDRNEKYKVRSIHSPGVLYKYWKPDFFSSSDTTIFFFVHMRLIVQNWNVAKM
jgi:hypothetical protein